MPTETGAAFLDEDYPVEVKTFQSQRERLSRRFTDTDLDRHSRRWTCLVGCFCSPWSWDKKKRAANLQSRREVCLHIASVTAALSKESPSCLTWLRGSIALLRESRLESAAAVKSWHSAGLLTVGTAQSSDGCHGLSDNTQRVRWRGDEVLDLGVTIPTLKHLQDSADCSHVASTASTASTATSRYQVLGRPPLADIACVSAHFARLATAAYTAKLYLLMKPWMSCFGCCLSDHRAFAWMSGVNRSDIIDARRIARPFKPAWWLARDRQTQSIVLAIRGTFSHHDLLSDLFACEEEYQGHVFHHGALAAAKVVYGEVLPLLKDRCQELRKDDYKLVITGHSLGGAVASVVAWMLRGEDLKKKSSEDSYPDCICFTFGAPPVMDRTLAASMQRFVVGVTHHMDVFARFSVRSLEGLRDRVRAKADPGIERLLQLEDTLRRLGLPRDPAALECAIFNLAAAAGAKVEHLPGGQRLTTGGPFYDACEDEVEANSAKDSLIKLQDVLAAEADSDAKLMRNAGWLLHIGRCRGDGCLAFLRNVPGPIVRTGALSRTVLTMQTPSDTFYDSIRVDWSMWTDHWPQSYQYVCEVLARRLKRMGTEKANDGGRKCSCDEHAAVTKATSDAAALRRVISYLDG
eukprot:TRINITY_DN17024_c0_g1_i1.p1 TRINITY_DN17024_c0_g1~~TRINITY_DN17024_c0_g1_i1.p1  ORF type:complete len:651 (+),score=99.35 TRINITY_DN17024_c0_g1_i1:53-1954(+)